jgi:hypothetical protein
LCLRDVHTSRPPGSWAINSKTLINIKTATQSQYSESLWKALCFPTNFLSK